MLDNESLFIKSLMGIHTNVNGNTSITQNGVRIRITDINRNVPHGIGGTLYPVRGAKYTYQIRTRDIPPNDPSGYEIAISYDPKDMNLLIMGLGDHEDMDRILILSFRWHHVIDEDNPKLHGWRSAYKAIIDIGSRESL